MKGAGTRGAACLLTGSGSRRQFTHGKAHDFKGGETDQDGRGGGLPRRQPAGGREARPSGADQGREGPARQQAEAGERAGAGRVEAAVARSLGRGMNAEA